MENYRLKIYPIETSKGVEWAAEYPDVPECVGGGYTPEEALSMAKQSLEAYQAYLKEEGNELPKSTKEPDYDYSGRFSLRVPKSLHKRIAETAEAEGVSINSLITVAVSKYIGQEEAKSEFRKFLNKLDMKNVLVNEEPEEYK